MKFSSSGYYPIKLEYDDKARHICKYCLRSELRSDYFADSAWHQRVILLPAAECAGIRKEIN